jgi:hypothetical protein
MTNYTKIDNEWADSLLLGSENIDKMIRRLTELTHMLIGVLFPLAPNQGAIPFVSDDRKVLWVVSFKEDALHRRTIIITGHTVFDTGSTITFNSAHPDSCIKKELWRVYGARGVLISGLKTAFPSLIQDTAHFIEASQVKLPD